MKNPNKYWCLILLLVLTAFTANAQELSIQLGSDEVGLNEMFTITVTVQDGTIKNYTDFPFIDGFSQRGTSSSSKTNIVNGKISSSQSITQRYMPLEKGTFRLAPFTITVNGVELSSQGKTIQVTEEVSRGNSRRNRFDPFSNFLRDEPSGNDDFVEVEEDAFLALTTDKNEVYVGEGFNMTLAFYVADGNRAPLQFHEAGQQLSKILKELRPANAWEENFNIDNIYGERTRLNGKNYTRYKIYRASYFPLNADDIIFPSVPFEMIKYRVARSPSFFGRDRQEDYKTFYSKEKRVRVKPLPPHPMKDVVVVGDFELDEYASTYEATTGESLTYNFNIFGEGNISGMKDPVPGEHPNIDIYPPAVDASINRASGRVTGSKKYSFFMIPNEPGTYNLGDYFNWVYFSTSKNRYDTLRSEAVIKVTGESKENVSISSTDLGDFYDNISLVSNEAASLNPNNTFLIVANLLIIALLGGALFIFFKK